MPVRGSSSAISRAPPRRSRPSARRTASSWRFRALPLVLLISALSRLLYHWGVLQLVVTSIGKVLERAFAITGPVGTSAAANIFVGMVEAPLLVRPYLASMSRGDLFATMTVGMATIAGTMLAIYASLVERTCRAPPGT